jgi:Domain of unknown function (DUF4287)
MATHHSAETHQQLLDRITHVTGHDVSHWLRCLESGPTLLRFEERVDWLRREHELPHGYAAAVVHEQDKRRSSLRVGTALA